MRLNSRKKAAIMLAAAMTVSVLPMAAFAEEGETEEFQTDAEVEEEGSTEAFEQTYSYSEPFDENGYFKGVTALDYVTLGTYAGMEIALEDIIPGEEDIMAELQSLVDSNTTTEQITDTSRRVEDGDTVNIDYEGKMDGVAFEGGTATGTDVTIGVTNFIEGFLDQLIGHTPGETFDIDVTFPDPYYNNPDFSGKPAVFTITINHIVESVVPDLDDELIADATSGEFATVEEYREHVGMELQNTNLQDAILAKLFEESEVSEVPQSVIDALYTQQYQQLSEQASYYGMTLEDMLAYYGMTLDDLNAELMAEAEEFGNRFLVIQAVREDAGLELTSEKAMEMLDAGEELYDMYVSIYGEPYIFFSESTDLVLDYLVENANVTGAEEIEELISEADEEAVSEAEEAAEEVVSEAEEAAEEAVSEAEEAVEEAVSEAAEAAEELVSEAVEEAESAAE